MFNVAVAVIALVLVLAVSFRPKSTLAFRKRLTLITTLKV